MGESDASSQGQDLSQPEDHWQDQILGDAIGYTRGLVAVLDSLTAGFRRRGRELEEQRQRLAILQNERRAVLEERAGLEAHLRSLTTERDALRTDLEERTRDIERLRQDLATARERLEANVRELLQLHTALAASARQAEELREIVRKLERDNESRAQQLLRLGELQRELVEARDAAAEAHHRQVELQEGLGRAESLLESARKETASAQAESDRLRASLEAERNLTASLQGELQTHRQDLSRLSLVARTCSTILTEIAGIVGTPVDMEAGALQPDDAATQLQGLVQALRGQAETATETQKEIAALTSLVESIRDILGTTEALPDRLGEVLAERQALQRQLQDIGVERQRLQEELAGSVRREQQAREEAQRLSERVSALLAELEAQRAGTDRVQAALAAVPRHQTDAAPQAPPPLTAEAAPEGRPESAALPVECSVEGAGEDTPEGLLGQPSRINEVGMVIALHKCLSAGRVVIARFRRGREEFSVPGSVVRSQPSRGRAGATPSFDHLIRFEHPNLESSRRLKAFLP